VDTGLCAQTGIMGSCTQRPNICPLAFIPVCGCDGQTYGNACEAAQAGVNVATTGACANTGMCTSSRDCGDGALCDFTPNTCGAGGAMGACRPLPQACPDVYLPVCGCDGNTYGNACDAAAAGVDVAQDGVCASSATCSVANDTCLSGQWCDYTPNSCGSAAATGTCQQRPQACPLVFNPVCGCDGRTYSNACLAAQAGVDQLASGECATTTACGARAGDTCQRDEYCDFEPNQCGRTDGQGICQPRPQVCPDVYLPVCGCDGNTYGNSCDAAAAGVDVSSDGPCQNAPVCGGLLGELCPAGTFCDFEPNSCGAGDEQGFCRQLPRVCPDVWAPVCGCDNNTYSNACDAAAAGVDVASDGVCPSVDGCSATMACPTGEYCDWADLSCGAAGRMGRCVTQPSVCPDIYAPVCGCDGNTYSNACDAAAAGVDVASDGACNTPNACSAAQGCANGQYCNYEPNSCGVASGISGTCEVTPIQCPLIFRPVCGCNGLTYGNQCEAAAAGVDMASEGACDSVALCGGPGSPTCNAASYCDYASNGCGVQDELGTCRPRPDACPRILDPVCGCNSVTYSNSCEAAAAGMDVATAGPCP